MPRFTRLPMIIYFDSGGTVRISGARFRGRGLGYASSTSPTTIVELVNQEFDSLGGHLAQSLIFE